MGTDFSGDVISLRNCIQDGLSLINSMGREDVIYIISHIDADGISTAGIITKLLSLLDKPFVVKFVTQLRPDIIRDLQETIEPRELIFCDLGSGQLEFLTKILHSATRMLILDHHIPRELLGNIPFKLVHLNSWLYGINGDSESSSSSMAYLLARPLAYQGVSEIFHLARYALVGALGDNQDIGHNRSLIGLNKLIKDEAEEKNIVKTRIDIILNGREIKPLYQALAETFNPLIPGISGSLEGSAKFIISLGLSRGGLDIERLSLNDLSEEKKALLVEKILERISLSYPGKQVLERIRTKLLGYIYEFPNEKGLLKYGRDFATLLNACGRMDHPGIGLSLIINEFNMDAYNKALSIYKQYKYTISNMLSRINDLLEKRGALAIIDGREFINEKIASPIASIISQSLNEPTIVVVLSKSTNDYVKVSIRRTSLLENIDVRRILEKTLSNLPDAYYGGHEAAAGAYIPNEKVDKFIADLDKALNLDRS